MSSHPAPPPSLPTDTHPLPLISRRIKHPTWTECQLTAQTPITTDSQWGCIEPLLTGPGTSILNTDFFGMKARWASLSAEMRVHGISGPETVLLPDFGGDGGMQIGTLSGIDSTPILDGGRLIGRFFEDADAKYCFLGDVLPANPNASRNDQASQVFETFRTVLAQGGMDFRDVVRTWFYVDRILEWYGDFNKVRTTFFEKNGIVRMPASTGIGVPNVAGAAVVAKAVAVQPKTRNVVVKPLHSPLQCEAAAYGSSFSRAMEVADLSTRTIYVSGTASIEPEGKTIHVGNTAGQIETTMEVVSALLAQAGLDLSNTTRAIGYFRSSEDIPLWHDFCRAHRIPPMPILLTQSEVCRDDLLFEIELDATADA